MKSSSERQRNARLGSARQGLGSAAQGKKSKARKACICLTKLCVCLSNQYLRALSRKLSMKFFLFTSTQKFQYADVFDIRNYSVFFCLVFW